MLTTEEINAMTPEQIAKLNKQLMRKIVLTRIVGPIAIIAAVHIGVKLWDKRQNSETN